MKGRLKAEHAFQTALAPLLRPENLTAATDKARGAALATHAGTMLCSTRSRPKAAGRLRSHLAGRGIVSTHSRAKAAGRLKLSGKNFPAFQLTAARRRLDMACGIDKAVARVSTHSRPKAAGNALPAASPSVVFQLTAARRRLGIRRQRRPCRCFNSQPPEGGWRLAKA